MKKQRFFGLYIAVICSVAIALSSCYNNEDFIVPEVDTSLPIQLFNEIVQVPTTRVNDEGFCDGDAVGIYVVNFENGASGTLRTENNQADNVKYIYDETNNKWIPEEDVYFLDRNTHVDIYGYYPYANPSSIGAYPFEVQKDQSTAASNGTLGGYEASDFLWGKAADIAPTASRINLKFNHRMAGVQITLVEGTGWNDGEWAQVEKSALVTNTKRKATIDLATGEITATGDVQTTGIVPYINNDDFRAVVVPQTISAGTAMFSLTVDGLPYVYRYRVDGTTTDFEYLSGKLHKFSIEVSKKPESGGLEFKVLGNSITAWETDNASHDASAREYIIINVPESNPSESALKLAIANAGYNYADIKNLKVTGEISMADFYFMRDDMHKLQSINLKEVTIGEGWMSNSANKIPDGAFYGKSMLVRFIFPDNTEYIGGNAFLETNLTGSLIIPNGVRQIGDRAFDELSSLNGTLTLPSSLTHVGYKAFGACNFVGTLDIPESVVSIGEYAFGRCMHLTGNLILPESLEFLGVGAFSDCASLSGSIKIPSKITKIEDYVFCQCNGLDGDLILHDNIQTIGDWAFSSCGFRGELNLPNSLVVIGRYAFQGTHFSGTLSLPNELAVIGSSAFAFCNRLTGVVEIPNGINAISDGLFFVKE